MIQVALEVKSSLVNAGDSRDESFISGSGRSPLEGNGNPLQDSCLGNSVDGGAWWATVHGVTKTHTHIHTHRVMTSKFIFNLSSCLMNSKGILV